MKRQKSTKYAYWKWVILDKIVKLDKDKILIYDKINDDIIIYSISKRQIECIDYETTLRVGFQIGTFKTNLTIGELAKFYNSLPNNYKKIFWDSIG